MRPITRAFATNALDQQQENPQSLSFHNDTLPLIDVQDLTDSEDELYDTPKPIHINMDASKILDLIPYYNAGDKVEHFVRKAQIIFDLLTTDPEKILFATIVCLKISGSVLETLSVQQQQSWEDIKAALLRDRPRVPSLEVLQTNLTMMHQLPSENAQAFGARITNLHKDLIMAYRNELTMEEQEIPASTIRILERQVTRTFEDGLRNPELRTLALVREAPTLAAAVSFIADREARIESRTDKRTSRENKTSSNLPINCYRCGLSGHYANACNNSSRLTHIKTEPRNYPNTGTPCRYCGVPSHDISKCQERINNNMRRFGTPDKPQNYHQGSSYQSPNRSYYSQPSRAPPQDRTSENTNGTRAPTRNPFSRPNREASPPRRSPNAQVNLVTQPGQDSPLAGPAYPFQVLQDDSTSPEN